MIFSSTTGCGFDFTRGYRPSSLSGRNAVGVAMLCEVDDLALMLLAAAPLR